MDSSNRPLDLTSFIMGTLKIHASQVTSEEWARILNFLAGEINPIFKYLNSRPLSHILNGKWSFIGDDNDGQRITDVTTIRTPANIPLTTRCLELHYDYQCLDKNGMDRRKWRGLFLLENKKFALWEGVYDRIEFRKDKSVYCEVTELDEKTLSHYLSERWSRSGYVGPTIFDRLNEAWIKLIRDRQAHLNSLCNAQGFIDGILNRVIR